MQIIVKHISKTLTLLPQYKFSQESQNISFLQMVESYFDKAGKHTNIRADKLNFYKKPDNVVKFHLTLTKGKNDMI